MKATGACRGQRAHRAELANRRELLRRAGTLALAAVGPSCRSSREDRPANVLWILSDQHRADVAGFAGNALAHTPHLDRLASQSAVVTDMYCQVPLCVPSRQSILTGQYAHTHGSFRNWHSPDPLERTIAHELQEAGFFTALIGKSHCNTAGFELVRETEQQEREFKTTHPHARLPGEGWYTRRLLDFERDYLQSMNPGYRPAGEGEVFFMEAAVARDALAAIEDRPAGRPFFVWASFVNPHPPLFPPPHALELFAQADLPLHGPMDVHEPGLFRALVQRRVEQELDTVTPGELMNITRAYYASVAWTDECIGSLLVGLDKLGLAEETIVVYTSDHGEMLGQHGLLQKRTFYEGAMRVPCLVRWPGRIAPRVHTRVAQHIDLIATLFDWLGLQPRLALEGRSMRSVLAGEASVWEDLAIAEIVLDGPRGEKVGQQEESEGLPKGFGWMIRMGPWKYIEHNQTEQALFDLATDPGENHNLIGVSERRDQIRASQKKLAALTPRKWAYRDDPAPRDIKEEERDG